MVIQPEGKALADYDENNTLIDIVQVKARTANLTIADLNTNAGGSFFYRTTAELKNAPDATGLLVSCGSLGLELTGAFNGNKPDIVRVIGKLRTLSGDAARHFISNTRLEIVDESKHTEHVFRVLRKMQTGIDAEAEVAVDMLTCWLYRCAENRTLIRSQDVLTKVTSILQFCAYNARRASKKVAPVVSTQPRFKVRIERQVE